LIGQPGTAFLEKWLSCPVRWEQWLLPT
jgi:hypothetical protein